MPLTGAVSVSCQVIHGPGLVGSTAEPPATDGFSASCVVWMLIDGTSTPLERTAILSGEDPLALVGVAGVIEAAREDVVVAEAGAEGVLVPGRPGTVRPAPAKSIDGASPSCFWLKFSDP